VVLLIENIPPAASQKNLFFHHPPTWLKTGMAVMAKNHTQQALKINTIACQSRIAQTNIANRYDDILSGAPPRTGKSGTQRIKNFSYLRNSFCSKRAYLP